MVRHRGAVPPGPGPRPGRAPLPLLGRRPTRPVPSRRRRYARAGQRSAAGPSRRSGAGRRARRRWGTARAPLCGRAAPGQRARRCLVPAGPLGAGGRGRAGIGLPSPDALAPGARELGRLGRGSVPARGLGGSGLRTEVQPGDPRPAAFRAPALFAWGGRSNCFIIAVRDHL